MTELEVRREAHMTPTPPITAEPAGAMRLVEWAREAEAAAHLARALVSTPFAGSWKGDADGATAAILKGAEVGLTPVTALGAFDNIQGRPAPSALTLRAFVQAHGHELEIVEETAERAVARYRRKGAADWSVTDFTIEDARSMGLLTRDQWKKQPRQMLIARVTAKAARLVAADVILGIGYSSEEIRDETPWDGTTLPPRRAGLGSVLEPTPIDPAAGNEAPEPMTDKSRREMFALFTDKGVPDSDQLSGINHLCDTNYTSRGDLTEAHARQVIDFLRTKQSVARPGGDRPDGGGAEAAWEQIEIQGQRLKMSKADLEDDCQTFLNVTAGEATAEQLGEYLKDLQGRAS